MDVEENSSSSSAKSMKVVRCMDWLQKQNSQQVKKSLQNKNDIQFIIQMNADRKNFLLSAAEDEASVPPGVLESTAEPEPVPVRSLKTEKLNLECDWQSCRKVFTDYEVFQKHVSVHSKDLHVIRKDVAEVEYVCQWDVCGHKTSDFREMSRHINYHAYHAKLLAVGFNARATLKLLRCRKDSTKRNHLPPLLGEHCCMWTGCNQVFDSIQRLYDHTRLHVLYCDARAHVCSWAGCGARFTRRAQLAVHARSHTGERQLACFHCGQHFANNRKLLDHLRRQNVNPSSPWLCTMCGKYCATEYLLKEHSRMHVSAYACALCDMSAQSAHALALHVRYRHLAARTRTHSCPLCDYRAITKWDLQKHVLTHNRKKKRPRPTKDTDFSDENSDSEPEVKKRAPRKYACHLCPEKKMKVFCRGTKLTTHLVKVHGAQWPFGYSRFRYQLSEDGMYRLMTTRYEDIEVSQKILDGYSGPKESLNNDLEFTIEQTSQATETTPTTFQILLKDDTEESGKETAVKTDIDIDETKVEIELCDVDDKGNIIKSEVIYEL